MLPWSTWVLFVLACTFSRDATAISCATCMAKGKRPEMEDRTVCTTHSLPGGGNVRFAAVFDGHGGQVTASYLQRELPPTLRQSLDDHWLQLLGHTGDKEEAGALSWQAIQHTLEKAVRDTIQTLSKEALQLQADPTDGSTLVLALLYKGDTHDCALQANAIPSYPPQSAVCHARSTPRSEQQGCSGQQVPECSAATAGISVCHNDQELLECTPGSPGVPLCYGGRTAATLIAHVGDSSALFCHTWSGKGQVLTQPHAPGVPSERARIEAHRGRVFPRSAHGLLRLQGELAVSRALGDAHYLQYGLISEPELHWHQLTDGTLLLISDGVMDGFTPDDLCALVKGAQGGDSMSAQLDKARGGNAIALPPPQPMPLDSDPLGAFEEDGFASIAMEEEAGGGLDGDDENNEAAGLEVEGTCGCWQGAGDGASLLLQAPFGPQTALCSIAAMLIRATLLRSTDNVAVTVLPVGCASDDDDHDDATSTTAECSDPPFLHKGQRLICDSAQKLIEGVCDVEQLSWQGMAAENVGNCHNARRGAQGEADTIATAAVAEDLDDGGDVLKRDVAAVESNLVGILQSSAVAAVAPVGHLADAPSLMDGTGKVALAVGEESTYALQDNMPQQVHHLHLPWQLLQQCRGSCGAVQTSGEATADGSCGPTSTPTGLDSVLMTDVLVGGTATEFLVDSDAMSGVWQQLQSQGHQGDDPGAPRQFRAAQPAQPHGYQLWLQQGDLPPDFEELLSLSVAQAQGMAPGAPAPSNGMHVLGWDAWTDAEEGYQVELTAQDPLIAGVAESGALEVLESMLRDDRHAQQRQQQQQQQEPAEWDLTALVAVPHAHLETVAPRAQHVCWTDAVSSMSGQDVALRSQDTSTAREQGGGGTWDLWDALLAVLSATVAAWRDVLIRLLSLLRVPLPHWKVNERSAQPGSSSKPGSSVYVPLPLVEHINERLAASVAGKQPNWHHSKRLDSSVNSVEVPDTIEAMDESHGTELRLGAAASKDVAQQPGRNALVLQQQLRWGCCRVVLRYKAGSRVGKGGFGEVWKGRRVWVRCQEADDKDCCEDAERGPQSATDEQDADTGFVMKRLTSSRKCKGGSAKATSGTAGPSDGPRDPKPEPSNCEQHDDYHMSGMRESYFGQLFQKQAHAHKDEQIRVWTKQRLVRFVESFHQPDGALWLVFRHEGRSLHSLMYQPVPGKQANNWAEAMGTAMERGRDSQATQLVSPLQTPPVVMLEQTDRQTDILPDMVSEMDQPVEPAINHISLASTPVMDPVYTVLSSSGSMRQGDLGPGQHKAAVGLPTPGIPVMQERVVAQDGVLVGVLPVRSRDPPGDPEAGPLEGRATDATAGAAAAAGTVLIMQPSRWWWRLRTVEGGEGLRAVLRGILQSLAAVHAADVVHRDVKPENIMLQLVNAARNEQQSKQGRGQDDKPQHASSGAEELKQHADLELLRLIDFGSAVDDHTKQHLYGVEGPVQAQQTEGYAPPEVRFHGRWVLNVSPHCKVPAAASSKAAPSAHGQTDGNHGKRAASGDIAQNEHVQSDSPRAKLTFRGDGAYDAASQTLQPSLTSAFDMWSVGVVALELLLGTPDVFEVPSHTRTAVLRRVAVGTLRLQRQQRDISQKLPENLLLLLRGMIELCILPPYLQSLEGTAGDGERVAQEQQQRRRRQGVSWSCTDQSVMQVLASRDPIKKGFPGGVAGVRLLRSLLSWDPAVRPSAERALQHAFFHLPLDDLAEVACEQALGILNQRGTVPDSAWC